MLAVKYIFWIKCQPIKDISVPVSRALLHFLSAVNRIMKLRRFPYAETCIFANFSVSDALYKHHNLHTLQLQWSRTDKYFSDIQVIVCLHQDSPWHFQNSIYGSGWNTRCNVARMPHSVHAIEDTAVKHLVIYSLD